MLENFEISMSGLYSAFLFGMIGMWLFSVGKKKANYYLIFIGVGLMVYPYFTHGPFVDWGVGTLLCGAAYYKWNA